MPWWLRCALRLHLALVLLVLAGFGGVFEARGAEAGSPWNAQPVWDPAGEALADEPYASGERAGGEATRGRFGQRLLYSFEEGRDGQPLRAPDASGLELTASADQGVTHGRFAARVLARAAKDDYATLEFEAEQRAHWGDYEYLAVDVYNPESGGVDFQLDLLDAEARNYQTRCTLVLTARPGANRLLFPIKRALRNGRTGLSESQLLPADLVNREALRAVRLFFAARPDRAITLWIDNIRLLQEDAATPRMQVPLPGCTVAAFDFGPAGAAVPGFTAVPAPGGVPGGEAGQAAAQADPAVAPELQHRFTAGVIEQGGGGWPDLLAGSFVQARPGEVMRFEVALPNGDYRVWLCAGRRLLPDPGRRQFVLRLNANLLRREEPTDEAYDGTDYLHRFLWTRYSERPQALWLDYISRMYEVQTAPVRVTEGRLVLTARNHFISALIILPAEDGGDGARLAARLERIRRETFERLTPPRPAGRAVAKASAGAGGERWGYLLSSPQAAGDARGSAALPELKLDPQPMPARLGLALAGAGGQNLFLRLDCRVLREVGTLRLELGDLRGPGGTLAAAAMRGFVANDRYTPDGPHPAGLLPTLSVPGEVGLTARFWVWLQVPLGTAAGFYRGEFRLQRGDGVAERLPVVVEVHPFALDQPLTCAMGMYYDGRHPPAPPPGREEAVMRAQFEAMRSLGFTSVTLNGVAEVQAVQAAEGRVVLRVDPRPLELARAAGLGAHPAQPLLVRQLDLARAIGRRLPGSAGAAMERQPGIELQQPAFRPLWFDAMRQYKTFLDGLGLPYAVEVVDEPREAPNPWNRNLRDTLTYGEWMGLVGLRRFVTPMADRNGGRDYTPLVAQTDILSVHGVGGSEGLVRAARAAGRDLWFYNIGMGRFSWGFAPWSQGATGRFEWHWSWVETWREATGGYPGREWHNPFTAVTAMAPNAPITTGTPGGFLFCEDFFGAAEGITDYLYLQALERRVTIWEAEGAAKAALLRRARTLLGRIRMEAGSGRQRGMEDWRRELAELLR